jgi:hypothetical protein
MDALIDPDRLVRLQDTSVERWHAGPIVHDQREPLWKQILLNHASNFGLWHEEDKARDPTSDDHVIATVKRTIDRLNQERTDAIEHIDDAVLALLKVTPGATRDALPLHSETVGAIVDRLSILSLRIFHMREEAHRPSADAAHRERCAARVQALLEQRTDLAGALRTLLADLREGRKRFKVYRPMKMYNDPSLNPVLYGKGK